MLVNESLLGNEIAITNFLLPTQLIPKLPIQDRMDVDLRILLINAYEALLVAFACAGFGCVYRLNGLFWQSR